MFAHQKGSSSVSVSVTETEIERMIENFGRMVENLAKMGENSSREAKEIANSIDQRAEERTLSAMAAEEREYYALEV